MPGISKTGIEAFTSVGVKRTDNDLAALELARYSAFAAETLNVAAKYASSSVKTDAFYQQEGGTVNDADAVQKARQEVIATIANIPAASTLNRSAADIQAAYKEQYENLNTVLANARAAVGNEKVLIDALDKVVEKDIYNVDATATVSTDGCSRAVTAAKTSEYTAHLAKVAPKLEKEMKALKAVIEQLEDTSAAGSTADVRLSTVLNNKNKNFTATIVKDEAGVRNAFLAPVSNATIFTDVLVQAHAYAAKPLASGAGSKRIDRDTRRLAQTDALFLRVLELEERAEAYGEDGFKSALVDLNQHLREEIAGGALTATTQKTAAVGSSYRSHLEKAAKVHDAFGLEQRVKAIKDDAFTAKAPADTTTTGLAASQKAKLVDGPAIAPEAKVKARTFAAEIRAICAD